MVIFIVFIQVSTIMLGLAVGNDNRKGNERNGLL